MMRVPFMLVCGAKEVESGTVALRTRSGKDLGAFSTEDLISFIKQDIISRGLENRKEKDH
jgi:threonyl-tRNA synthetase